MNPRHSRVYFVYVDEPFHSGQRRATELIIADLAKGGRWEPFRVPLPGLNRETWIGFSLVKTAVHAAIALVAFAFRFWRTPGLLHVNLSQSYAGFCREGAAILLAAASGARRRIAISLHGSWFMSWPEKNKKARLLSSLVRRTSLITVLGTDQQTKLRAFGIPEDKILIVDNTSDIAPLPAEAVASKHSSSQPINVLFLSHLIDTKGYPEFLEALIAYAAFPNVPAIHAKLCGDVVQAAFSSRFRSTGEARSYIDEKIRIINSSHSVRVEWIRHIDGAAKANEFRAADVFVFPSKLEAQPIVLLEAMASGCAIICSEVGQIPSMVGDAAVLLKVAHPESIAAALRGLVLSQESRTQLGLAALKRFQSRFSREVYKGKWESIFGELTERSSRRPTNHRRIVFAFANPRAPSGQREAARLIWIGLDRRQWHVQWAKLPALSRGRPSILGGLSGGFALGRSMLLGAGMLLSRRKVLHVTLAQTRWGMLRDTFPFIPAMFARKRKSTVISLNGSNFMKWDVEQMEARFLRFLVEHSSKITVVSARQRQKAIALGLPPKKVVVVPNTCDGAVLSENEVRQKHRSRGPLRVMFLSNLIDTKGYPEYLEALGALCGTPGPRVDAYLCGRVVLSQYGGRFQSEEEATQWIDARLAAINRSGRVSLTWVKEVEGELKWKFFTETHIFVFPSTYRVEAQPIALLEAMATGCAIVSSNVGEIDSIIDDRVAVITEPPSVDRIAEAIEVLLRDDNRRDHLALEALRRFSLNFTKETYGRAWEPILEEAWAKEATA